LGNPGNLHAKHAFVSGPMSLPSSAPTYRTEKVIGLMDALHKSLLVVLLVGACAPSNYVAEKGRQHLLGMDTATLQSCAGIPTRTTRLDSRTELYSYENKYENTGGLQITLPIIGGGFRLGGSGSYCHALIRVVDGKVVAVNYTGDNDESIGKEGVCAPIVRGCIRVHERALDARTGN
jgi:hypothetical protein